jgi:membrane protease YdiL (CAAX protease family)
MKDSVGKMDRNISRHQAITWIVILGLLILRLIFEGWIRYVLPSATTWVEPIYEIGTYALTVFLIGWEWKNLKEYHLDPLTILILILFPVLSKIILSIYDSTSLMGFPKLLSFPFFIVAGFLIYLVFKNRKSVKQGMGKALIWFFASAIFGLFFAAVETIFMIKLLGFPKGNNPGLLALISPFYQLGYAASAEEPLFRGFLWGALRKLRFKEFWILIIQALLFSLGHLFYLKSSSGLLFVGMIFISALVMGLLVWRTRSISSSMAFHAFTNGSSLFLYWVEWFVLK